MMKKSKNKKNKKWEGHHHPRPHVAPPCLPSLILAMCVAMKTTNYMK